MTKQEWLKKLKQDQTYREGLGMYVLDSFNEEIARILAYHDKKLIQNIINIIENNIPHDICSGEEAIEEMRHTLSHLSAGLLSYSEEDVQEERS